jgi:hypothetical protein
VAVPSDTEEFKHLLTDLYFRLEERDRWSDHTLRYLLTGNGGGVALLMTLLGAMGKNGQWMPRLLIPLVFFLAGIVAVGIVVGHSTACIRKGRRASRKLIVRYLQGQVSYADAFREMGTYKSKWEGFESGALFAFLFFILGVLSSGWVYMSTNQASTFIAPTQPVCTCVLARPAAGTPAAPSPKANATRPPPGAPDQSASPAAHRK